MLLTGMVVLSACAGRPTATPYRIELDATPLIAALGGDDDSEHDAAVSRLAGLGPAALPALAAAWKREPSAVRVGIVEVLQEMQDPAAVPPLLDAARDPDPGIASVALEALAFAGDERAEVIVETALTNPDADIQRSAAFACARLCRSPQAITTVATMAMRADDPVAQQSILALAASPEPTRAQAARTAIEAVTRPAKGNERPAAEQLRAAILLAAVGDPSAPASIATLARREDAGPRRAEALLVLGGSSQPSAVAALESLAAAADLDPALHGSACASLVGLAQRHVDGADAALHAHCSPRQPPPAPAVH